MSDEKQEPRDGEDLDQRITESLLRQFSVESVPESHLALLERNRTATESDASLKTKEKVQKWWYTPLVATAATLLIAASGYFVFQSMFTNGPDGPSFAQVPLSQLYRDEVAQGFTPYYDCSDPARFRDTFLHRQSVPLKLKELPVGQSMLGLSYPGGISRDTTAILFLFREQPVVVYVDRSEIEFELADLDRQELNVFKTTKGALVLYEVTPLDEPRFLSFLTIEQAAVPLSISER